MELEVQVSEPALFQGGGGVASLIEQQQFIADISTISTRGCNRSSAWRNDQKWGCSSRTGMCRTVPPLATKATECPVAGGRVLRRSQRRGGRPPMDGRHRRQKLLLDR